MPILVGGITYMVGSSDENRNTPRGLLGNFNGNRQDDFTSSDGTQIPINSSMRDIHYKFGLSWRTLAAESLFTYLPGKSHAAYQNPAFTPSFRVPSENEVPANVREVCRNSSTCIYDYVTTGGNLAIANATVLSEERVKEIQTSQNVTVIMCPKLNISTYAVLQTTNGFFDSSIATLLCAGDSRLVGNNITTCSNGSWTVAIGDCVAIEPTMTFTTTKKVDENNGFFLFRSPFLFSSV